MNKKDFKNFLLNNKINRQELNKADYKASVELLNNYNYAAIQG